MVGIRGGGGTNSEDVDVAFDGAFVGREDVDCEGGVEACDRTGLQWDLGDWGGGGEAQESEGGGEKWEFHIERMKGMELEKM